MLRTTTLLCFLGLSVLSVHAATVTYTTPAGATTGGGAVDATAMFTTTAGQLTVTLTNNEANPTDVAQLLSSLTFNLSGVTSATLTNSAGQLVTVAADGSYSNTAGSIGWLLTNSGNTFSLCDLCAGAAGPSELIIGPPGPGNKYTNANGSIAGNGPHNPFIFETATFTITSAAITADTTVSNVVFGFGTVTQSVPGVPTGQEPPPVPEPASMMLMGSALVGVYAWRKRAA